eukprot:4856407-Amphidinium_carterae.1
MTFKDDVLNSIKQLHSKSEMFITDFLIMTNFHLLSDILESLDLLRPITAVWGGQCRKRKAGTCKLQLLTWKQKHRECSELRHGVQTSDARDFPA